MIKKFKELDDNEILDLDPEELREAYRKLREHHIVETTTLYARVAAAKAEAKNLRLLAEEQVAQTLVKAFIESGGLDLSKVLKSQEISEPPCANCKCTLVAHHWDNGPCSLCECKRYVNQSASVC